jgi:hypothetical protein
MSSIDDQAKHDLKWIGIWAATTLIFALIGYFGRNDWWIAALVTGAFLYFYGLASFGAWRDRVAQAKRDDEDDALAMSRRCVGGAAAGHCSPAGGELEPAGTVRGEPSTNSHTPP